MYALNNIQRKGTHAALALACGVLLAGMLPAAIAHAQMVTNLGSGPLFSESNFVPGEMATGTITIENQGSDTEEVYIVGYNESDLDGLAADLHIVITEGSTIHYDAPLSNFLQVNDGDIQLSDLGSGEDAAYDLIVSFLDSGTTQGATLAFDICIGFAGGEFECAGGGDGSNGDNGDNNNDNNGSTPPPPQTFSSTGGGGILPPTLQIFNEQGQVVPPTSGLLTWDTNVPASTQVVYGLQSGGPYSLDLNDASYGYPLATVEDFANATDHSVTIPGLTPGETYVYRLISRESPTSQPTISPEFTITVASPQPLAQGTPGTPGGTGGGGAGGGGGGDDTPTDEGGGDEEDDTGTSTEQTQDGNDQQAAAAFLGLPADFFTFFDSLTCPLWFLLILLAVLLATFGAHRALNWGELPRQTQRIRQLGTAISLLIILALIAPALSLACVTLPLLLVAALLFVWLLTHTRIGSRFGKKSQ